MLETHFLSIDFILVFQKKISRLQDKMCQSKTIIMSVNSMRIYWNPPTNNKLNTENIPTKKVKY